MLQCSTLMAEYYFLAGEEVRGPFTLADCFSLIQHKTLTPASLICVAGQEEWRRLDTYPELKGCKCAVPERVYAGPGALTICGGILLAVFILGLGGELLVKYEQQQEAAATAKIHAATRLARLQQEAAEARRSEAAANRRAEAERATRVSALMPEREEPIPIPTPTPVIHHFAPAGTFYVTDYISVRTAKGVAGFEPGQEVKLVRTDTSKGTSVVTDGKVQGEVPTIRLTNDLDIAAEFRQRDQRDQAEAQDALRQTERLAASARHQIDLAHAATVANLPSGSVVGGHSTLDKPAEQVGSWNSGYYNAGDNTPADDSLRSVGGGQ